MLGYEDRDAVTMLGYAVLVVLPIWYLATYLLSPLRHCPGPFLAGWTNLWRMFHVRQGQYHVVVHKLHKQYGPVVRLGPNVVDLDFPELIKTIYNTKGNYLKTEFYHGSSIKRNGKIIYNLFSECNPEIHAKQKRPISKHYSLTGVLRLEPHVDDMIESLCQRLVDKFIDETEPSPFCDLGEWVNYYTWDVVGKATFSQPLGYLENGCDFDNTLKIANIAIDYFSLVSQMPILDHLLDKNPIYRIGPPAFGRITNISIQHIVDRVQSKDSHYHDSSNPDFLDRFIEAKEKFPDVVDDMQILSYLMNNMVAGADTTSITINSVLYFALKHPHVWERLRAEISSSQSSGDKVISYKSAREFPYLDAVVREAMRCHPGVGLPLERYVPKEGLSLPNGAFIPAGSIVALNPYVTSRNTSVWGEDAEKFRPERWLCDESQETNDEYQERLRLMNSADFTFGAGSRSCVGKHFAVLQIYKVIATLVSRYDIQLAHPKREWKTHNSLFIRQSGIDVKLARRA